MGLGLGLGLGLVGCGLGLGLGLVGCGLGLGLGLVGCGLGLGLGLVGLWPRNIPAGYQILDFTFFHQILDFTFCLLYGIGKAWLRNLKFHLSLAQHCFQKRGHSSHVFLFYHMAIKEEPWQKGFPKYATGYR